MARKTKASRIDLETAVDNYSAQALYEELGYERDTQFLQVFAGARLNSAGKHQAHFPDDVRTHSQDHSCASSNALRNADTMSSTWSRVMISGGDMMQTLISGRTSNPNW